MSPDVRRRITTGRRIARPQIRHLDRLRLAFGAVFRREQAHEHPRRLWLLRIMQPQRLADGSVDLGPADDAVDCRAHSTERERERERERFAMVCEFRSE